MMNGLCHLFIFAILCMNLKYSISKHLAAFVYSLRTDIYDMDLARTCMVFFVFTCNFILLLFVVCFYSLIPSFSIETLFNQPMFCLIKYLSNLKLCLFL